MFVKAYHRYACDCQSKCAVPKSVKERYYRKKYGKIGDLILDK